MKYYKRLKVYKASNVEFDPQTMIATSYDWWEFVKEINGKIVFNDYSYSNSTRKHQYKVNHLLFELNIKTDLVIECPKGLQDLNSGIIYYKSKIKELNDEMLKPRTHAKKNAERLRESLFYLERISLIEKLLEPEKVEIINQPRYTGFIEALEKLG